jgi:tetratricopeptide (TPR) repeat protein
MLKSARLFWGVVAGAALASGSVQAQQSPDWTRCINQGGRFAPDVAISACSNVISSAADTKLNLAIVYARRGSAYHDRREYDRAIADYTKIIEIKPRDAVAYNNRGMAYRAKGDNDSAIADYTKAIDIDPTDARAHNNRGIAYRAKGDNDRAIADQTRAVEIDPEFSSAYNSRGIAYRAKGDNDRAIADHTKAIEIDPELAGAFYNRSLAYHAKGDSDHAIEDATAAIKISPGHGGAYLIRGLVHGARGNLERAIADYTKAIQINPKNASAHHHRGLAYAAKGDHDSATADSTAAAEIERKQADLAAVPASTANAQVSLAAPHDAPGPPFTLVLKTDLGAQQLTVVENDAVAHVWPISSGTRGYATPTGTFQPTSANRMWYSRQYNWTPMPYAVFFVRGVAFHGTNVTSRLGKSASHGCIRLATSNAAQLFDLVHKHGFEKTQIVIFGTARHDPPLVAKAVPATEAKTAASNGLPWWARTLFDQSR